MTAQDPKRSFVRCQLSETCLISGRCGTDYDWRKVEATLNARPNFITEIDVRLPHPNALPLVINRGWPGSVVEQLKIIDPVGQAWTPRRVIA